jgi:hypothetical protein
MTCLDEDDATNHFSAKTLSAGCFVSFRETCVNSALAAR